MAAAVKAEAYWRMEKLLADPASLNAPTKNGINSGAPVDASVLVEKITPLRITEISLLAVRRTTHNLVDGFVLLWITNEF